MILSVAALVSTLYVSTIERPKLPELKFKEIHVPTTQELINKSKFSKKLDSLDSVQLSTSKMIREVIKEDVIDSVVRPKDTTNYGEIH